MFKFECDKCGGSVYESTYDTMLGYDEEVSYLVDSKGNFDVNLLPEYIVFKCHTCGYNMKISMYDIINPFRKVVLDRLSEFRMRGSALHIKDNVLLEDGFEDNGISFCGFCQGFLDGDGYCYNDVIENCIVRSSILEKRL